MKTVQSMLAEADAAVPRISPDEAKGLLGRADVLFLDVRETVRGRGIGQGPRRRRRAARPRRIPRRSGLADA